MFVGGFGLNVHLDAIDCPESFGRYINDIRVASMHNVKFLKLKEERKALVLALRDIKNGEELYVSYGESFWRGHGKCEEEKNLTGHKIL